MIYSEIAIDRYGFLGSIPTFPKFLNFVFCFIIKNIMYSMPYLFLKNFKNRVLRAKIFQIAAISIFCYDF